MAAQNPDDKFRPVPQGEEHTLLEVGSDSRGVTTPDALKTSDVQSLASDRHAAVDPNPRTVLQVGPQGGLRFGPVRVTQQLGAGGMGKVYRGHHEGLDLDVAIKVMSGEVAKDETGRQRFIREARTAARLDHPNIVRVMTVDEQDGAPFIVMEYVDGADMAALVKKHGRLDPIGVLRSIAQVSDALAHAHEQGIIHRDIKPHNMFVSRQGRVKLGDFGLARAVEQTTELTMPGAAMGTAHYMSPEQAGGHELDTRSDIYSLGVTAYHLLSGMPPYRGTTPVSIAVQHINSDVPYTRESFGHVPDEAVYLLIEMTARDAARRPTAAQVSQRLRDILGRLTGNADVKLASLEALVGQASSLPPDDRQTGSLPHATQQQPFAIQHPPGFTPVPPTYAPTMMAPLPMHQQFPTPSQGFMSPPGYAPPPKKGANWLLIIAIIIVAFLGIALLAFITSHRGR
ncbi:MAG: protein kinase [Planctomycetes bacterium]|nr:protein kinase [Planctomycetota bacterium]